MRVLMYGWEFPPRISGGLGVACHAIVKELTKKEVTLTLVLPESTSVDMVNVECISGSALIKTTPGTAAVANEQITVKYPALHTFLKPYLAAKECQFSLTQEQLIQFFALIMQLHVPLELKELADAIMQSQADASKITAKYGVNLLAEVLRYAAVAGSLAYNTPHDVIYAHDWLTMLAGVEAKRCSNKPLVVHVHALETDRSSLWVNKKIYAIEKFGMEQADHVIAVSQYTKDCIVRHYGIAPEKISVVHNGIYPEEFLQKKINFRPDLKMILFLGRITHQKGPYFFIEIAKRILQCRKDVQFVLAGTGDEMTDMIERVAELRIGTNVHFTGFLQGEHLKSIYQLADVYVMSSVSEPFGISVLEALSNDVPAVISKQSGVSEVLHHTLRADFWDTEEMAAKILALLAYPALRKTILANTKPELAQISWASAADKIVGVFAAVTNK